MNARRLTVLAAALALAASGTTARGSSITPVQCFQAPGVERGCTPAIGLQGAAAVTVSPDGRTVYVGGNVEEHGVLLVYARDAASGALMPLQCFADPPTVRAAPDAGCVADESLY